MSFADTKLTEAQEALSDRNVESAVGALVELWAKIPSTRIAAVIDKLSARLPRQELPKKVAEREEKWLELAQSRDPKIVPTLISGEWPVHPRGVKARIEQLIEFPPDPRIAHAIRELWLGGRYRSHAGGVFWRKAFRLLLNWNDPEATALIEAAKKSEDGFEIVQPILLKRTKTPLPTNPELSPKIEAALKEIESLGGIQAPSADTAKSRENLFAAVYEDPSSDAAKLVLADFLLQEEDPRGELIQLMNAIESGRGSRKAEARVKVLLRASGKKWLDGVVAAEPQFRSGFATEVTVQHKLNPSVSPAWATIETIHLQFEDYLDLEGEKALAAALAHPHLRSLKYLHGLTLRVFERSIAPELDRSFDRLVLFAEEPVLQPIEATKVRARHLGIERGIEEDLDFRTVSDWFDRSAFKPPHGKTKVLQADATDDNLASAHEYLKRNPSLDAVWLVPTTHYTRSAVVWELHLSRDANGEPSVLEAIWNGHLTFSDRSGSEIGGSIAALPKGSLTHVTVRKAEETAFATRIKLALESSHPSATLVVE